MTYRGRDPDAPGDDDAALAALRLKGQLARGEATAAAPLATARGGRALVRRSASAVGFASHPAVSGAGAWVAFLALWVGGVPAWAAGVACVVGVVAVRALSSAAGAGALRRVRALPFAVEGYEVRLGVPPREGGRVSAVVRFAGAAPDEGFVRDVVAGYDPRATVTRSGEREVTIARAELVRPKALTNLALHRWFTALADTVLVPLHRRHPVERVTL